MMRTENRAPTLYELQRWMAAQVLSPGVSDLPPGAVAQLDGCLAVPRRVSPIERLNVYVHGYPARIRDALAEAFPAVAHVIGEAAFTRLTERYLRHHAPRSYNLNDAGAQLPTFLCRDELVGSVPFLPDLAELEWRVMRAFHSHEQAPLEPGSLATWAATDWEEAVLHFQPSVAVVRSAWPIRAIWETRHTPVEEIDIDVRDHAENVIIYRRGLTVCCDATSRGEAQALAALLDQRPLSDVCRRLEPEGHAAPEVMAWFTRWMQAGLIVDCTTHRQRFRTPA